MSRSPIGAALRWAVAEARALVMLERFVGLLDQPVAETAALPSSRRALVLVVREWRRALRSGDDAAALEAGARTWSALDACRQGVVERDRALPAYRIRWACEHAPLGASGLGKLARFYRSLPYSPASQSKYEYVATRLLAGPLKRRRQMLEAPDAALQRLVGIQRSCGADAVEVPETQLRILVAELAGFVRLARAQPDLPSLTTSTVFQRAGAFKAGLGQALFEPRVALAVVECNLALGNVLCELLAREAEGAPAEATLTEPVAAPQAVAPAAAPAAAPGPEKPPAIEDPSPTPSPRAAELAQRPENAALIVSYLTPPRSAEVYGLDLDRFLSPLPGDAAQQLPAEAAERRRAFELILAADDLVWARSEGNASDEHKARVKQASREMLAVENKLRGLLPKAQQAAPEVVEALFYVSDHLLWARLSLTASLNRPPRKRISLAQTTPPVVEAEPEPGPRRRRARAWIGLAAAALFLLLPGLVVEPKPIDDEVRVLSPTSLPGGAHIFDARQHRSVLFVSVWPSWSWQGPGLQRDHLRALGEFGASFGIDTVSLCDRDGIPLGSYAEGEPTLVSDLPLEGS